MITKKEVTKTVTPCEHCGSTKLDEIDPDSMFCGECGELPKGYSRQESEKKEAITIDQPKEEETFTCDICGKDTPWSKGAADDHPDTCDDCVAEMARRAILSAVEE